MILWKSDRTLDVSIFCIEKVQDSDGGQDIVFSKMDIIKCYILIDYDAEFYLIRNHNFSSVFRNTPASFELITKTHL